MTREWETGACARTRFTMDETADGHLTLSIGAAQGAFRGQPAARAYEIRVFGRAITPTPDTTSTTAAGHYSTFKSSALSTAQEHRMAID